MTAVAGIFQTRGGDDAAAHESPARSMLRAMAARGAARADSWHEGGSALAVARHAWEFAPGFAGPVLIVQDGSVTVAADAALYYRDDLRRAIAAAGVRPTGQTPAHLIAAAYRAWGVRCAERLEGDFAFVLFDRKARRVLAARDFTGCRPLHFAELPGGTLVIASTVGGVLAHPECPRTLDLTEIAVDAAGLSLAIDERTSYSAVRRLNPGQTLLREAGRPVACWRHWEPARAPSGKATSLEEGAGELRELLAAAVYERLDPSAPTSVWMSGGWDSTSIFGAGQHALSRAADARSIVPVSLRLPDDDPGCETSHIEATARRWNAPVHWIDIADVPLLHEESLTQRDEPWYHTYRGTHLSLCAESRAAGASVALIGHGGDLLFSGTPVYAADLLRTGRLLTLARAWRRDLRGSRKALLRWGVQPLLPRVLLDVAGRARSRRVPNVFERDIPRWFCPEFVRRSGLEARAADGGARAPSGSRTGYEMAWLLANPVMGRSCADQHDAALRGGLEARWPLMDRRVIEFATSRPFEERRWDGETKRLLRHAMKGLLPDEVLAPRPFKTGTMSGYFKQAFAAVLPRIAQAARAPLLAELGVVDPGALQRAVRIAGGPNSDFGSNVRLLETYQVEIWLRQQHTGSMDDVPYETLERHARVPAVSV